MLEKLRCSWDWGSADIVCPITQHGEHLLSGDVCSTVLPGTQKATAEKKIALKGREKTDFSCRVWNVSLNKTFPKFVFFTLFAMTPIYFDVKPL